MKESECGEGRRFIRICGQRFKDSFANFIMKRDKTEHQSSMAEASSSGKVEHISLPVNL